MIFSRSITRISHDVADTENLARDIAAIVPFGTGVLLHGDLGMGKTVFARAFIRALTGDADLAVTSPTFNLVASYDGPAGTVLHYDFYRIKHAAELDELGLDEACRARATVVEWPDRGGDIVRYFKHIVSIQFCDGSDANQRRITIDLSGVTQLPKTAFIFAAGFGERMKPLTLTMPKPLVPVNGTPMLESIIELCASSSVKNLVVNSYYLGDQIAEFLEPYRDRFNITLSPEKDLLETGGGLCAALPHIKDDVFYAMNGDSLLVDDSGMPALLRLAGRFDPDIMDICLLLKPVDSDMITPSVGDYFMAPDGRLTRDKTQQGTHMFTGVRILHRRIFDGEQRKRFSFLDLMDKAEAAGRLFGVEHQGAWHHLSTPEDVTRVSEFLRGEQIAKVAAV
jgi:N-acetyl-alpha-D-muramate 1-phosphate uridylyltransferase